MNLQFLVRFECVHGYTQMERSIIKYTASLSASGSRFSVCSILSSIFITTSLAPAETGGGLQCIIAATVGSPMYTTAHCCCCYCHICCYCCCPGSWISPSILEPAGDNPQPKTWRAAAAVWPNIWGTTVSIRRDDGIYFDSLSPFIYTRFNFKHPIIVSLLLWILYIKCAAWNA